MDDDSADEHHPELFDSFVLDSLNKLAEEIHDDLRADEDSAACSSGSYNSDDDDEDDEYSDDDEDPDSGETKLFSMMDDLVMELQLELNLAGDDGVTRDDDANPLPEMLDKQQVTSEVVRDEIVDNVTPTLCLSTEDAENIGVASTEASDFGSHGLIPPVDRTNLPHTSNHNVTEKHIRLHQNVKSLLRRVADLTYASQHGSRNTLDEDYSTASKEEEGDESVDRRHTPTTDSLVTLNEEGTNPGSNGNDPGRRRRGDSSADRMERLLGAISSYSKARDPKKEIPRSEHSQSTQAELSHRIGTIEATDGQGTEKQLGMTCDALQQPTTVDADLDDVAAIESNKAARAISVYTQRKRREYLIRKQSSDGGDAGGHDLDMSEAVTDDDVDPTTVKPRRPKTSRDLETESTNKAHLETVERGDKSTVEVSPTPRQRQPRQPTSNKKYKAKRRTNKHKKRKPRRGVLQVTGGVENVVPESAESISQQSLRALLSSLLALDYKLSKETAFNAS